MKALLCIDTVNSQYAWEFYVSWVGFVNIKCHILKAL